MRKSKKPIKLNVQKLDELQKIRNLNDTELAALIGVSSSTLWRVRLPVEDERYNAPGEDFIAGALNAFPECRFEDLFFLTKHMRGRNIESIAG